jgi:hypothetical protein
MLKRTLLVLVLVSGLGIALPGKAVASRSIVGRVTDYNGASLSVRDREVLTVTLDERTTYSKLITQKPWQADTRLTASALGVGRFVVVHVRTDNPAVADWVQIATDMRPVPAVSDPRPAFFAPQPATAGSVTSKAAASDLLTSKQVRELIASAKTSADHLKLQKHYLALAAKYEADAAEHAADAQAYRKNPNFVESKNPSGPGTAAHCERFAQLDREAAKEARDLAAAHEHMAASK